MDAVQQSLRLILLGAPGAGKGTQAELLKSRLGFAHISTGDLIRAEVASGSPLAAEMKAVQASGKLVSDAMVETLLRNALAKLGGKPVIFDGYPRNQAQAGTLDSILAADAGKTPGKTVCLKLEIDEAKLFDRITGRMNCKSCKTLYNIKSKPPSKAGFCDACGSELVQREDDRPDTLRTRLETYRAETLPLMNYYSAMGRLVSVDGEGEMEAVFGRLKSALDAVSAT